MKKSGEKSEKKIKNSGDMTTGNPWRKLIFFAIPVLLGSILQQLYNAVDAVIVGQFVGSNALGAVGSTGSIVQFLIALFTGLASGTCVVVANYYGKKDKDNVNKTVHTSMILAVIAGIAMSIIGVILSPVILRLMNTPAEMMTDAVAYLQIYFAGMVGLAIYNVGASILQAVGNSKYPLYFLMATTILNVIGDILFVVVFNMGVAGAAIATIVAQFVSAALVLAVLMKSKREYQLSLKKLKIDKPLMKRIISIGLPAALQQSIVSISNIMVQSYINGLGTSAVAGYAATNKVDAFLPLPISAMALSVTTYVSQNLGAGNEKRARNGVWISLGIAISFTAFLSMIVLITNTMIFRLFSSEPDVLESAWRFAQVIVPFYILLAFTNILPGALRGAGNVKFATITCISCFVVLRQIYLFAVTKATYTIFTVALSYPLTWAVCAGIILFYYLKKNRISCEGLTRIHLLHTDGLNTDFLQLCHKLDEFQSKNVPGWHEAGLTSTYGLENLKDIFLLYDGPVVIGCAGLWCHDEETCEAVRVYVDDSYRGKGYSKTLLKEVQTLAKSRGFKQIHVRAFNTLPTDVHDYEEFGFSQIDPSDFKYVDRYSPALLLAPLRVYMRTELL